MTNKEVKRLKLCNVLNQAPRLNRIDKISLVIKKEFGPIPVITDELITKLTTLYANGKSVSEKVSILRILHEIEKELTAVPPEKWQCFDCIRSRINRYINGTK